MTALYTMANIKRNYKDPTTQPVGGAHTPSPVGSANYLIRHTPRRPALNVIGMFYRGEHVCWLASFLSFRKTVRFAKDVLNAGVSSSIVGKNGARVLPILVARCVLLKRTPEDQGCPHEDEQKRRSNFKTATFPSRNVHFLAPGVG